MCVRIYVCICVCVCVCVCVCMICCLLAICLDPSLSPYLYEHVCMYICIYPCVYVFMCVCVCIYIYIYDASWRFISRSRSFTAQETTELTYAYVCMYIRMCAYVRAAFVWCTTSYTVYIHLCIYFIYMHIHIMWYRNMDIHIRQRTYTRRYAPQTPPYLQT
jgi:hypothetical protein